MNYLLIYVRGMLMGIADLVPGVSGGTIALITGIYQRLIDAIAAVNHQALQRLLKGQFAACWQSIDGWFLLSVFAGIISAIFVFASLISHLLTAHAVLTWSFFFGLILFSAVMLLYQNHSKSFLNGLFVLIGMALGYVLSTQPMGVLPTGNWGLFLAGTIAICAMILPGISGSLILILLGKYTLLVAAVESREWVTLLFFAMGCVVGLMLFSRLLKWLLSHYHHPTIHLLAGLMAGTLFRVWPWQVERVQVSPMNHPNPQWLAALSLMLLAGLLVWLMFRFNRQYTESGSTE